MRNWWVDERFQAVEMASLYIFREYHNSRLSKRQAGKSIFEAGSFVARTWSDHSGAVNGARNTLP